MVFDSGNARLLVVDRAAEVLDRDDAFAVTANADGSGWCLEVGSGWCLEVHIAGVADVVAPGSDVDATAFLRRESKYFPTRTVPMLGRATELARHVDPDGGSVDVAGPHRVVQGRVDVGSDSRPWVGAGGPVRGGQTQRRRPHSRIGRGPTPR